MSLKYSEVLSVLVTRAALTLVLKVELLRVSAGAREAQTSVPAQS